MTERSASQQHRSFARRCCSPLETPLWKLVTWFNCTFGLYMLEFWEKALFWMIMIFISSLLWYSLIFHLPSNLRFIISRTTYYLFGSIDASSSSSSISSSLAGAMSTPAIQVGGAAFAGKDWAGVSSGLGAAVKAIGSDKIEL